MVSLADYLDRRLDRELQGGHDRRAERRGDLRPDRARDAARLPAHDRPGPAGAARGVDARVRPAEHDRARAQRADRGARHGDGRAGRGAASPPTQALAMLEPGDILVDCTGHAIGHARPAAPGRRPRASATGTRCGSGSSTPWSSPSSTTSTTRATSTASTTRTVENAGYKFIPAVHRTFYDGVGQPRDRHRRHQPGRVRGDAPVIRRRLAARQLPGRRGVDGPVHRQGQGGDARRARRRPRDHPDPARRLPRQERDEPALAAIRHRPPAGERAGLPARRLGDRVAVLPVDLARPGVRVLPRRPHRQPGDVDRR